MSEMQIDQVLAQMRSLAQQAGFHDATPAEPQQTDFASLLRQSLDHVNELQHNSRTLATAFEQGDPEVTLVSTMIAAQKASIAFEAVSTVRGHLLSAYKDVMSMSV